MDLTSPPPPPLARTRMATLLLLHNFGAGSWLVTLGYYMSHTLHFERIVGVAYSMLGIAAVLSSLFAGLLADHYFAAQRLCCVLQVAAGAALLVLSGFAHTEASFLATMLLLCVCLTMTGPLATAMAMAILADPAREFPGVRAAGTVGWVLAGMTIGLIPGAAATTLPLQIAAASYALAGLYCLTLPHVPPAMSGTKLDIVGALGLDILRGDRNRNHTHTNTHTLNRDRTQTRTLWIFFGCVLAVAIPKKFYDSLLNTFLAEKGMVVTLGGLRLEATAIQTLGQVVEALTLLALAPMIARLGIKRIMLLGLAAWVVRYVLFAYGFEGSQPVVWMLILGILLHGLSYDFFFVAGQLWLEQRLGAEMRNRAQSLFFFVLSGVGAVIGANLAGWVFSLNSHGTAGRDWTSIWLVPSAITAVTFAAFALTFDRKGRAAASATGRP